MERASEAPPSDHATDDGRAWPAEPLTRVLELLAEHGGLRLEPRAAWEAAAEGLAGGGGDPMRSLALAGRRAGLRLGGSPLRWPAEPRALLRLDGPTLSWAPGPRGGRWLLLLGRRRRRVNVALVDLTGEQRLTLTPRQLTAWLERELGAASGSPPRWVQSEPLLPLVSLGALAQPNRQPPGPLARLMALVRVEREDVGVVLVYAVGIGGMSLAVPVAVQALVNSVALSSVLQPLVVLSVLLAASLGFVAVLRILQAVVVEALQRRLFVRVAADFARRLPRLASAERRALHGPELANRFFDVVTLQKAGAGLLIDGLALVLQMAAGMLLLAFYHPLLLAFDLALLVAVAAVVLVAGRGALATSLVESKRKYAIASWLEDLAGSPLRFADARSRAFADARAELMIREWLRAREDHFSRVLRQLSGGIGLQVIASTALLGIGGWLVLQRQLTLGQLVAAELVVTAIGAGLGKLGKQLEGLYDATTSATKLAKVVDLPLERGGGQLLGGEGPIGVTVRERAADGQGAALIELAPGSKLGVLGRTPAESDQLDALFGLDGGGELDVRLDGCALPDLDVEALRAELALVRGVELVTGSLLDNLDLSPIPSDAAAVREVLELVGLDDRVAALPEGLRTQLLPNGWPLRGAEARRLMLAQALLRRPRLLLIDGGLDGLGLDEPTRRRLLDHLFCAAAPWTLIVITNDPKLLDRCTHTARAPMLAAPRGVN